MPAADDDKPATLFALTGKRGMTMSEQYAIETHELTKYYGSVRALNKLNLAVRQGEIFGFLHIADHAVDQIVDRIPVFIQQLIICFIISGFSLIDKY